MSLPAREVERRSGSAPAPNRPASSPRTTAARPRNAIPPQRYRRARPGLHPTFLIFATSVVVLLVIGVVALNAMFAQTAFAVHETQARVTDLREQRAVLATDAARLSSPGRIADWAAAYQMVPARDIVILHVSGRGSAEAP